MGRLPPSLPLVMFWLTEKGICDLCDRASVVGKWREDVLLCDDCARAVTGQPVAEPPHAGSGEMNPAAALRIQAN